MRELRSIIKAVADLRAKAGTLIGEPIAKDLEALARKARELDFFFEQKVEQLQAGPEGVARWTDQNFVARVRAGIVVNDPPDDRYSEEFESIFHRVLELLRPYL